MVGGVRLGAGHAKQAMVGHQDFGDFGDGGVGTFSTGDIEPVQRNADLATTRLDPVPLGCVRSGWLGSSGVDTSRGLGTRCESGGILGRQDAPVPHQRPGGEGLFAGHASIAAFLTRADNLASRRQPYSERCSSGVPWFYDLTISYSTGKQKNPHSKKTRIVKFVVSKL